MQFSIGNQYSKDDAFKAKARLHQSKYRYEVLKTDFDEYGNRLSKVDAENYLNFYAKLGVIETLKSRYPKYSKKLYADMLRSEHIPFNVFAPLKQDLSLAGRVLNRLFQGVKIQSIERIEIEYAPQPSDNFLKDRTSFDVYIEFITGNCEPAFLGIEVKYTEQDYKLKKGSREEDAINKAKSPYNRISEEQHLFIPDAISLLKTDRLRQIWRNHLLGESMLIQPALNFKHFISVIFYPSENHHFNEVIPEYQALLLPEHKCKLQGITFEAFFETLSLFATNKEFKDWIDYLKARYIV